MRAFETAKGLALWHPRYWPMRFGRFLLKMIAKLPYHTQMKLGRRAGHLLMKVLPKQRHIVNVNLGLCFPEQTSEQRKALLKANFESVGMGAIELATAGYMSDKRFDALVQVQGLEHLEAAQALERPIILLTAHFHMLPLMGKIVSRHVSFFAVMRPQRNRMFNQELNQLSLKLGVTLVHRHDVQKMRTCLTQREFMLYLPDQDFGRKHSIFAPFFGVQAATTTALHRLACASNAVIVPVFCERLKNDKGYRVDFKPALGGFEKDTVQDDVARLNHVIEEAIRVCPEQYLWMYKRFRTRPDGEQDFYK